MMAFTGVVSSAPETPSLFLFPGAKIFIIKKAEYTKKSPVITNLWGSFLNHTANTRQRKEAKPKIAETKFPNETIKEIMMMAI